MQNSMRNLLWMHHLPGTLLSPNEHISCTILLRYGKETPHSSWGHKTEGSPVPAGSCQTHSDHTDTMADPSIERADTY